jgi:phosphoglycolate phosphatase
MKPESDRSSAVPSPLALESALETIGRYRHVIWDWNGTLFDDVGLCVDLISELLIKRGLPPISIERYRDIFTFPVKNYYAATGLDLEREPFERVGREWMDEYERRKHGCALHPGMGELLEGIAARGIGQSILSAYSQHTLIELVGHCGLTKYFQHLYGLDNIYAASKVDQGRKLMAILGHGPGETLLIGDTAHDYDVAREVGADCLLIAHGHQSLERLAKLGVPVFRGFAGVCDPKSV